MCGICGIYSFAGDPVIDRPLLHAMTDTLVHRGPDACGIFSNGRVGLGHRRLSIIDLASGQQPILNEDGTKVIVFNGEIYNYRPLREFLLAKGHRFQTRSDTEVILHLYEELGEACVLKLRGMFAFAIWDQSERTLFLARDRLGVKPLYYCVHNGRCVFGSELKAIVRDPSIPRELDLEALDQYFSLLYVPAPRSIFCHVKKLPAGHTLTVTPSGPKLRQYWDLRFDPCQTEGLTELELTRQLQEVLTECVDIRLMSEVPLGAFLSGGIDSSTVVGVMAGLMQQPVNTSAIGFPEDRFNELPYARQVAQHFRTNHHEYVVQPQVTDVLEKLSWYFDEPFADASAVPTYYVSKMAREQVTVALSGDGGDENFAGYRRYYFDRLENTLRGYLPGWSRRSLVASLARIYPKADWLPQIFRAKTLLRNLSLSPVEGYFGTMSSFSQAMKHQLYSSDYRAALNGHYKTSDLFEQYFRQVERADPLSAIQYVDFKTYLVDDICTKVDRASMANSLEVRNPLLDYKLVEFAASIPWNYKLRGREGKYILKQAVKSFVPHDVLYRRKMGFCMPVSRWLRSELASFSKERLEELGNHNSALFDKAYIRLLLREHRSGLRDHSSPLWSLLMFQLWQEKFLPKASAPG
jgi:asparagine synthase (glutamine-hydrolysing)